jgi:glycerol-3-phosphate dehydrogenase
MSRKEEVFIADSGLISIAGGKLTGYRIMAKRVVDIAAEKLQNRMSGKYPSCKTHQIKLWGNSFETQDAMEEFLRALEKRVTAVQLPVSRASYLLQNYGSQSGKVLEAMEAEESPDAETRLLLAELHYAIREESVVCPMDFLLRRTGRAYFEMQSLEHYLPLVLKVFQQQWEWSGEQCAEEEAIVHIALDKLSMRHG